MYFSRKQYSFKKCFREIFDSVKEAGERLNVNPSNISNVLKGRQKSVKGHRFEYLEV